MLAVVGALNNMTDLHRDAEASRRDAEASRRDADVARRDVEAARCDVEAARTEAVLQSTAVLKQVLSTAVTYPDVDIPDKTRPTGSFTTGEADHDAAEAASVTTAGGSPNAPIMPPASDFFLDERDSALARTHNYCVHPSARPICAHLIAHRHDLSLTDGTGRFAQHLPSSRCSRAMPVGR